MKINRQGSTENYQVTVDWLKDFADRYKPMQPSEFSSHGTSRKFSSIEEKLNDIKSRIGFDLLKRTDYNTDSKIATESKTACHCKDHGNCECETNVKTAFISRDEQVKLMENILEYTKQLISHEYSNLSMALVLSRLRSEPDLMFERLPINMDKFKKYIEKLFSQYNTPGETVKYMPQDSLVETDSSNSADRNSEIWNHAHPGN